MNQCTNQWREFWKCFCFSCPSVRPPTLEVPDMFTCHGRLAAFVPQKQRRCTVALDAWRKTCENPIKTGPSCLSIKTMLMAFSMFSMSWQNESGQWKKSKSYSAFSKKSAEKGRCWLSQIYSKWPTFWKATVRLVQLWIRRAQRRFFLLQKYPGKPPISDSMVDVSSIPITKTPKLVLPPKTNFGDFCI